MLLCARLEFILDGGVAIKSLLEDTVDDSDVEIARPCVEVIEPQLKAKHEFLTAITCGEYNSRGLICLACILNSVDKHLVEGIEDHTGESYD